jgi:hypothetical protein
MDRAFGEWQCLEWVATLRVDNTTSWRAVCSGGRRRDCWQDARKCYPYNAGERERRMLSSLYAWSCLIWTIGIIGGITKYSGKRVQWEALLFAFELLVFRGTAPGSTDSVGAHPMSVVELQCVKRASSISGCWTLNPSLLFGLEHASRLVSPLLERLSLLVGNLLPASDHLAAAGTARAYTYRRCSRPELD